MVVFVMMDFASSRGSCGRIKLPKGDVSNEAIRSKVSQDRDWLWNGGVNHAPFLKRMSKNETTHDIIS